MNDPLNVFSPVGVVATNSPAYVETVFRLIEAGRCVVPLRSASDRDRLDASGASEVLPVLPGFGWMRPSWHPGPAERPAIVSFTSGTEGKAKGVVLTNGALTDVVERLNSVMVMDASVREYLGVPAYYSFGFGRCRAVAAVGGSIFFPEHGFDPVEISAMLRKGEINAISAVPSLWRTLLEARDLFDGIGSNVKWIEIGSQYMSREEKVALRDLFPAAKIVQHYGLTEASRSTLLPLHGVAEEHIESVGRAIGSVEVRIDDEGRLAVRGPHVASEIIIDGKRQPATDDGGWLETNDLCSVRDGYVYYHGRADDIINCGGLKLSPEALETAVHERTGVRHDFAICRTPDPIRGDAILLACTPSAAPSAKDLLEALVAEAASLGVQARGAVRLVEVAALPRTDTGKVQRKQLSKLPTRPIEIHESPASDAAPIEQELSEKERSLVGIWREALGVADVRVDESFYDLGGDSVSALSVVVRMSRAGIDMAVCRRIFQGATIRELAASGGDTKPGTDTGTTLGRQEYLSTLMVNVLRGLLVGSVVIGHWSPGALERIPSAQVLAPVLASFFSFGTPGFAIAFGVGFGYLYLGKVLEAPSRIRNVARLGTAIVGSGVVLLAALRLAVAEETISYANFFVYFYSALAFYLLALPTMPLWFAGIARIPQRMRLPSILLLAVACHVLGNVFRTVIGTEQPDGFLRLARLMLVAKYNYFTMMGGVLGGVAIGDFVRGSGDADTTTRRLSAAGTVALTLALGTAALLGQAEYLVVWPSPLTAWKWVLYWGTVALLLAGLLSLRAGYQDLPRPLRRTLEGLATVGQLALPFFVFHEAIVPLTGVLREVGIAGEWATLISLSVFVLGTWAMVSRVYQFFHSE